MVGDMGPKVGGGVKQQISFSSVILKLDMMAMYNLYHTCSFFFSLSVNKEYLFYVVGFII